MRGKIAAGSPKYCANALFHVKQRRACGKTHPTGRRPPSQAGGRFRSGVHVGIVFAQLQTGTRAAGEHAVGLGHAFGDQVVHQTHPDRLASRPGTHVSRVHRGLGACMQRGIDAGKQALRGRLFVAGGAIRSARQRTGRGSGVSRSCSSARGGRSSRTRWHSPGRTMWAFSRPAIAAHQVRTARQTASWYEMPLG